MYPPCSTPMEAAAVARRGGLLTQSRPGTISRARARTRGRGTVGVGGYSATPPAPRRKLLVASLGVREPQSPVEEAAAVEVDEYADEPAEIQAPLNVPTNTVRVKFVLEKECAFGQHFLVVGDDPALGLWDPAKAVALEWSDGHVWTATTDLPANKLIEFKFLLRDETGNVRWQDGGNRTLQTTDTPNTLVVREDWDHAQNQSVAENEELSVAAEEDVATVSDDLTGSAGTMLAVADELQPGDEDQESNTTAVVAGASLHEETEEANEENRTQVVLEEDQKKSYLNELYREADMAPQNGYYPSDYDDDGVSNEDSVAEDDAQTANRSTSIFENDLAWAQRALQHLLRFLGFQVGTTRT